MEFKDVINALPQDKKNYIFLDMDGTIAEFSYNEKEAIKENVKNVFFNKRPLSSIIKKIEEISKQKNIDLYILSLCLYDEQKDEKNKWLDINASFIKKDKRIIIVKTKEQYTKETKHYLKANYINKIVTDKDNVIMIDDDHQILKATKEKVEQIIPIHISMLID